MFNDSSFVFFFSLRLASFNANCLKALQQKDPQFDTLAKVTIYIEETNVWQNEISLHKSEKQLFGNGISASLILRFNEHCINTARGNSA